MDKAILAGILFVMILFMCFIAFAGGLYLGLKYKARPPEPELTQEQKKAIENKLEGIKFQAAQMAIKQMNFVVEADRAEFKYGDIINVSSTTNFVAVSGDKATVQLSVSGHVIGPNGVGGVTVDGFISGLQTSTDKKGNINCSFNVMGSAISALVEIMVPKGDNYATVYITPNYSSNRMKFYGVLVPAAKSSVFKGFAW